MQFNLAVGFALREEWEKASNIVTQLYRDGQDVSVQVCSLSSLFDLWFVLKFRKLPFDRRFCFWCSISPWEQDKWVDILSKPFQMINFKNTRLIDNIPQFQVDRARRIVRERCPAGSKMIDSGQWSFSPTGSLDWGGGRLVEIDWDGLSSGQLLFHWRLVPNVTLFSNRELMWH